MLYLRAFVTAGRADAVVHALEAVPEVRHVMRQPTADAREEMITADLSAVSVDPAISALLAIGLPAEQLTVERANRIGPVEQRRGEWLTHREDAMVWAEVVEGARENARLPARYLVYMAIAGVLAAFAVLLRNSVLMVGAMAVSPDLLPVTAACVGVVGRRPRLVGRSVGTLALGLAVAGITAWLLTLFLDAAGYLSTTVLPRGTSLIPAPTVTHSTILIAFVAGIAGMLATETRAGAAVGVAISVTTIPATAFAGVAAALGTSAEVLGGLATLGANVVMLLVGGTITLVIQRRLRRRLADDPLARTGS